MELHRWKAAYGEWSREVRGDDVLQGFVVLMSLPVGLWGGGRRRHREGSPIIVWSGYN